MKKVATLLSVIFIIAALCACSNAGKSGTEAENSTAAVQVENPEADMMQTEESEAEVLQTQGTTAANGESSDAEEESTTEPGTKEAGTTNNYEEETPEEPEYYLAEGVDVDALPAGTMLTEWDVAAYGEDRFFYIADISDEVFARMDGLTFKDYSPVTREELRYIRCLHKDLDGNIKIGELVMHESIAMDILDIFYELYQASYPIEKMILADDYDAEDLVSAADNNTSGYNTRYVEFTNVLCRHAYGMAIDINPLYNVYYLPDSDLALPEEGYIYKDRSWDFPYKITEDDLCCQLFIERGFTWGGWWGSPDYMHFEK